VSLTTRDELRIGKGMAYSRAEEEEVRSFIERTEGALPAPFPPIPVLEPRVGAYAESSQDPFRRMHARYVA